MKNTQKNKNKKFAKKTKGTILSRIQLLIILIGSAPLLLNAFFYEGFVQNHFNISPLIASLVCLAIFTIIRIVSRIGLSESIYQKLFWWFAPFISLFTVFLNVGEDLFFANFSFSIFHLHPEQMQLFTAYVLLVVLLGFEPAFLKKRKEWSYFVFPVIVLSNLLFFKWAYVSTYWHFLRREDGPFEYLTAIAFFTIAILAVLLIRRIKKLSLMKQYKRMLIVIFLVVAITGIFVAGEEISWGQRIFDLRTPKSWKEVNTQDELTIHNHELIMRYIYQVYFALALYCMISWIPAKIYSSKAPKQHLPLIKFISPAWYLMPMFIPTFMYTLGRFTIGWTYYGLGAWEETTEMILSLGLFFHFFTYYRHFDKILKPISLKAK